MQGRFHFILFLSSFHFMSYCVVLSSSFCLCPGIYGEALVHALSVIASSVKYFD